MDDLYHEKLDYMLKQLEIDNAIRLQETKEIHSQEFRDLLEAEIKLWEECKNILDNMNDQLEGGN